MKTYVTYKISHEFEHILDKEVKACLGPEASGRVHAVYAEGSKAAPFASCKRVREDFGAFDFVIMIFPEFFTDHILEISQRELGRQVTLPEMRIETIAHELAHISDLERRKVRDHEKSHSALTKEYYRAIMLGIDGKEDLLVYGMASRKLKDGTKMPNSYYYSLFDKSRPLPSMNMFCPDKAFSALVVEVQQ